jgi:tetratricopeptide (TPR) repeat protein
MALQTIGTAEILREAVAHHKEGRLDEAASLYEIALETAPRHADALHLLGVIAHQRGDHASAVQRIREAITISGDRASYHSNLGIAYRSLGRTAEAVEALRRSAQLDSTSAEVRYNLGNTLKDAKEFTEAAAAFRASVERDPGNPEAWTGLGDALREERQFEESRRCHERAISLSPRLADAHYNLGLTCGDEGNHSEAVFCFLRAASLRPDFTDAHVALGNLQEDLGDFRRAVASYDRALTLKPQLTAARFNRSLALLRQGDLAAGWNAYESRWRNNGKPRVFAEPEWDGSLQPEKTILVYSEQGVGDEIMFASCFGEAIERTKQCLIECDPRLRGLFARSFPAVRLFPRAGQIDPSDVQDLPAFDVQIAAGSLPRRLRPSFDAFSPHAGYLTPDPQRVTDWRSRFERLDAGLIVGISWRGGKDAATRRRRSTQLAQWAALFRIPGIAYVNLQYGDCDSEIEQCARDLGVTIHDWDDSDPLHDLDGFAAQVAALDLVISVDNATVHLAGALNVPVWTLLPFACDWRWFNSREDSPWYPSMRLFRQTSAREMALSDWDEVFQRTATALGDLAVERADQQIRRAARFQKEARLPEAIQCYLRAAALRPTHAETLNNLGVAWKEGGRSDLAIAAYRKAIDAQPRFATPWFNCGNAYREDNRLLEAVECYEEARQRSPNNPQILVNLAVALKDLRRLDAAYECLDEVLRVSPELPEARFDRSLIDLLRGDLGTGWDEYEWRLKHGQKPQPIALNRWDGDSLSGRSILVRSEQGIGDQVMFASCLHQIAPQSAACLVECDPRLVPLFARSFSNVTPIAPAADPTANPAAAHCDVCDFLGSLPRFFRRRIEDFPPTPAYLKPEPALVAKWRAQFARLGGALKVGISWRGGKDAETRRQRSIPIEFWRPILQVPGVRFVNLQYGPGAAEAATIRQRFDIPLDDGADCDPLADIDDFTAKIAALDLVLSVDNSTVHLAAAIGRPVWTLLPFSSDWRWMLDGETTPWYPTMRLLRCRTPDGWTDLLQRTARLLTAATFSRELLSGTERRMAVAELATE